MTNYDIWLIRFVFSISSTFQHLQLTFIWCFHYKYSHLIFKNSCEVNINIGPLYKWRSWSGYREVMKECEFLLSPLPLNPFRFHSTKLQKISIFFSFSLPSFPPSLSISLFGNDGVDVQKEDFWSFVLNYGSCPNSKHSCS